MADPKTSPQIRRVPRAKLAEAVKPSLEFHRKNLYMMGLAAISVVLGYVLLGARMLDLGSFLLVLGYLVLIPVAVMIK
jgi:hypothetical protein